MAEATLTAPVTPTTGTPAAPQAPASPASPPVAPVTSETKGEQTTEAKTEAPKGLLTEEPKKASLPEDYQPALEGERKLAEGVAKEYVAGAREAGLTPEAANKLVNRLTKAVDAQAKASAEAQIQTWAGELKAHPTLGGEKLEASLADARAALNEFGNDSLRELLKGGLQYHPGVIEMLAAVQKKVGGDRKFVASASSVSGPRSDAELFFGSSTKTGQ
jgi:hypothetical protein